MYIEQRPSTVSESSFVFSYLVYCNSGSVTHYELTLSYKVVQTLTPIENKQNKPTILNQHTDIPPKRF